MSIITYPPFVFGFVLGVIVTAAVVIAAALLADHAHHRTLAKRAQQSARRPPVWTEITQPKNHFTSRSREALETDGRKA